MIELISPENGALLPLLTPEQKHFLADEERRKAIPGGESFCFDAIIREGEEHSLPQPVLFRWRRDREDAYLCTLLLSENPLLSDYTASPVEETESLAVFNLLPGRTYYWAVAQGTRISEIRSFSTEPDLPRVIRVDGISNVRDLGGYPVPGGHIRFGLLYRGGEPDTHMELTAAGVEDLRRLGIRTQLDLRGEALRNGPWSPMSAAGVRRILAPVAGYKEMLLQGSRTSLQRIMAVLSEKENYPVYFNCWGGADRTGTLAFLLGALLGMEEPALVDQYEFTSLAVWGIRTRNYSEFQDFLKLLKSFPGKALREQTESFFLSAGIPGESLERIKEILIQQDEPEIKPREGENE